MALVRPARVGVFLLSRPFLPITFKQIQDGRRLNIGDKLGVDASADGQPSLHICVAPALTGSTGPTNSADRLHTKPNRNILPNEVGILAVSAFYVGDDGGLAPATGVPNEALDAPVRRDGPPIGDTASSPVGSPPSVPPLARDGPRRATLQPREARRSLTPTRRFALRPQKVAPPCFKRANIQLAPYKRPRRRRRPQGVGRLPNHVRG